MINSVVSSPLTLLNILSIFIPNGGNSDDLERRYQNEQKLLGKIFKDYDGDFPKTRPVNCIPYFSIDHVSELDESHQSVIVHGSFIFAWKDERLQWNISEFNNIRHVTRDKPLFRDAKLWLPSIHITDLFLKNENLLSMADSSDISISFNGLVRVQVQVQIKTTCFFHFGEYPNDYQNCTFSIFTPYDASEFMFSLSGRVEMVKYSMSGADRAPDVDLQDFKLIDCEADGYFTYLGTIIRKTISNLEPGYARSFFRYNLVFQRVNYFYTSRMAIPMICSTIFLGVAGMARGFPGLIWLLISLLYQVFTMIEMTEALPPDYDEIPMIGQMSIFLIVETTCLIIWRLFTIYVRQKWEKPMGDLPIEETNDDEIGRMKKIYMYNEVVNIGDGIIIVLLIVQMFMNCIVLL